MTELLTTAEMRALEQAAIASGAVTGLELMERAGRGVVGAILAEWPGFTRRPGRATVLCGPGNNGGDGFAVARLLWNRGWEVRVLWSGEADRQPPDAAAMRKLWQDRGPVQELTPETLRAGPESDLYVDAVFGLGLTRALTGPVSQALSHMAGLNGDAAYYRPRTVAIDAPSGLCLESGRAPGQADPETVPRARLTVTFHMLKPGHVLDVGPELCGRVAVVDLGLGQVWRRMVVRGPRRPPLIVIPPRPGDRPVIDPTPQLQKRAGHKFDHGHAAVIAGPAVRSGAARLAARAALRAGAGLVTLTAPSGSAAFLASAVTAVMLRPISAPDDLTAWITADQRISAILIGPGLGLDDKARALVAAVLGTARPTLLDADALTLIARDADLRAMVHKACVLTPHGGEFARLWPDLARRLAGPQPPPRMAPEGDWQTHRAAVDAYHAALAAERGPLYSRIDAARDAAKDIGAAVLLKGPDTVIGGPEGQVTVHTATGDRAAPWLATAGSGDVLAGIITGLLARGFAPLQAAATGAWLHVEAARAFGPGLIAEDLPEILPRVFRRLFAAGDTAAT